MSENPGLGATGVDAPVPPPGGVTASRSGSVTAVSSSSAEPSVCGLRGPSVAAPAKGGAPLSRRRAARLPAGVRVLGRTPNGLLVGLYGAACTGEITLVYPGRTSLPWAGPALCQARSNSSWRQLQPTKQDSIHKQSIMHSRRWYCARGILTEAWMKGLPAAALHCWG